MNDTGNLPIWDLNPATLTIVFLVLVMVIVFTLAIFTKKDD